tara:strand:- start:7464 stop:8270 length:807 start_codon:yes stop_codon:yes gene_type:complete
MFKGLTEVNKIYKVNSDVKFEHYYKNRPLTEAKVKDLQNSLKESNLLHINPIIVRKVNVKGVIIYKIIDGQHRNEAAIRENLTRYCIIDKSTDEHLMIKLNTQMKNWVLQNYAKYWSSVPETSEVYNIYLDYKKYYGKYTTDSIILMIWNNNRSVHRGRYRRDIEKGGNKSFKDGKLQFDTKIKRRLDKYLPMFEEVYCAAHNPPLQKSTVKRQVFQEVLMNATRKSKCFSYDKFIKNLCSYPHKFNELRLRSDIEQHMYEIERGSND